MFFQARQLYLPNFKILGVINLTPNSFFDGGKFLDDNNLLMQLNSFLAIENLIIDIGFESTAPMNQAVSAMEEKNRFHKFLNFLKIHPEIKFKKLSIDTYKPENFYYFYQELKKIQSDIQLIFNDVSGVLDEALAQTLIELDDVQYIFTCTRIPDRSKVLAHMQFCLNNEMSIIEECTNRFLYANNWFLKHNLQSRVLYDPGFGFSKSYAENWALIDQFTSLEAKLYSSGVKVPWVIGISRKSFLKKKCEIIQLASTEVEVLHDKVLKQFLANSTNDLFFRVHDPYILADSR